MKGKAMHDDEFWRDYEILHDYDYINEHKDDYGGYRRGGYPVYWTVVWIITIILGIACYKSPGIPLFFLALAFSFSFCL
ncbi:MAG: hypothetical protein K6G57_09050 [Lachnospiraceae bacterium]|nr:hypothetical protein [Lachnospiraceae bacterium]